MSDRIAEELIKILNLPKRTIWFEVMCRVGEDPVVRLECCPDGKINLDENGNPITILREIVLTEKKGG